MGYIKGIMLEGISCAGKTSIFNAVKEMHAKLPNAERNMIALGEHYSQVLNKTDKGYIRLTQETHRALLEERVQMLEQLNGWACSLGKASLRSRGIFALLERFYLNHLLAFGSRCLDMEERCNSLQLKCVLLTVSEENIAPRNRLRDEQMKIKRPLHELEKLAFAYNAEQKQLVEWANQISIPTLLINTDAMTWEAYSERILSC